MATKPRHRDHLLASQLRDQNWSGILPIRLPKADALVGRIVGPKPATAKALKRRNALFED